VRTTSSSPSLLTRKLFDEQGEGLTPTHTKKGQRRYRYYVSHSLLKGTGTEGWRLAAAEVEKIVAEAARKMLDVSAGVAIDEAAEPNRQGWPPANWNGGRLMIKRPVVLLTAILVLGLGFNYGAWAQSVEQRATQVQVEGVGYVTVVTFDGKIVDIDTGRKLVTLEGAAGRRVTVWVQNPDNLRTAKVGEPFAARFYEILNIRKKKPGETVQSATTVGEWTTNPLGVPGGSRANLTTMLVTVEAIDEANGTVTVKATDGTTKTVKARNPQNLKRLKVGDELVISLYRGVAISLGKESGAGAS
jgi:hypothetical protein